MVKFTHNNYNDLAKLGYTYNISEGGWVSQDKSTIVYEMRQPYVGQVKKFIFAPTNHEHDANLTKLREVGYIV